MSSASDKYEKDVATNVNKIPGVKAVRPPGDTAYADVKITYNKVSHWMEVKMNHTDNLSNPRVYYENGKWKTTYKTPSAKAAVDILNSDPKTKIFLKSISAFSGIPFKSLKIPTTKGGLKEEGAVPLEVMKRFFDQPNVNRYIANKAKCKRNRGDDTAGAQVAHALSRQRHFARRAGQFGGQGSTAGGAARRHRDPGRGGRSAHRIELVETARRQAHHRSGCGDPRASGARRRQ